MQLYIEAQEKLEMEATKHRMFYSYGCAFNLTRSIVVIPRIVVSNGTMAYDLYKNNRCVASSTNLEYIFEQVKKDLGMVPLRELTLNAKYVLLLTNSKQLKLVPIYLLERAVDGAFKIISDFTYTFDADGYSQLSGIKVQSLFCDLPSALDYLRVNYKRAELHFKRHVKSVSVTLDDFVIKERHVVFKAADTNEYIPLSKAGNGLSYLGDELTKMVIRQ